MSVLNNYLSALVVSFQNNLQEPVVAEGIYKALEAVMRTITELNAEDATEEEKESLCKACWEALEGIQEKEYADKARVVQIFRDQLEHQIREMSSYHFRR